MNVSSEKIPMEYTNVPVDNTANKFISTWGTGQVVMLYFKQTVVSD